MKDPESTWTRVQSASVDSTRVLVIQHVADDTFAISEDGGVSLSDKATLTLLLKQLSGREDP